MTTDNVRKLYKEFACQKINAEYLVLMTVSGSTIRAFKKGITYEEGEGKPLETFRNWMRTEVDVLSKTNINDFTVLYKNSYRSLSKFWEKSTKVNLAKPESEYLLYKLLDLFYKHIGLCLIISKKTRNCILQNATPALDSFVLMTIAQDRNSSLTIKHASLIESIPKKPRMGYTTKKSRKNFKSHSAFRSACHAYFRDWAKDHKVPPLAFDLIAWNQNSLALK